MKRFWIGVIFLAVLLAGSILLLAFSSSFYQDFSKALEAASALALNGDWSSATKSSENAQKKWNKSQYFLAAFTDHEPIAQVDQLFAQLALYGEKRMSVEFAVTCQQLRHCAEAINEAHSLKWWTVL